MPSGCPLLVAVVFLLSFARGDTMCKNEQEMFQEVYERFVHPFVTSAPVQPQDNKPEKFQTTFSLYTRANLFNAEVFTLDERGRMFRRLNPKRETKIIIHGWKTDGEMRLALELRKAFIRAIDINFVMVDWSWASKMHYFTAVTKVPLVGEALAEFIDKLVNEADVKIPDIHVVGFSLGAHIAGIAGRKMKSGKLSKLTGLDPARPSFPHESEHRLNTESAKFVIVIHTSALGYQDDIGHVDIHINGGLVQPGCNMKDITGKCSHSRAHNYYAEALVYPKSFQATLCPKWSDYKHGKCKGQPTIFMGENIDPSTRGVYMMATNNHAPWGKGSET